MAALAAAAVLGASPAWACPLCRSETGRRVREGLFDAHFGTNLAATLLPFPVFLAIIALIHFGAPRPKGRSRRVLPPGEVGSQRPRPSPDEDQTWTTS